jgi:magnesium-transporting ATPase (P-type)
MTDDRPRPQYGEYASPEEQILAGGTGGAGGAGAVPPSESAHGSNRASVAGAASFAAPKPETRVDGAAPAGVGGQLAPEKRPFDTFMTTLVLSLTAFVVISSSAGWANLPEALAQSYEQLGYGEFTSVELASTMGVVIAVMQSALLIAAALISIARLRAKRSAFWVPLVFGVSSMVLTLVLMMIVMLNDPALAAFIANQP